MLLVGERKKEKISWCKTKGIKKRNKFHSAIHNDTNGNQEGTVTGPSGTACWMKLGIIFPVN